MNLEQEGQKMHPIHLWFQRLMGRLNTCEWRLNVKVNLHMHEWEPKLNVNVSWVFVHAEILSKSPESQLTIGAVYMCQGYGQQMHEGKHMCTCTI